MNRACCKLDKKAGSGYKFFSLAIQDVLGMIEYQTSKRTIQYRKEQAGAH